MLGLLSLALLAGCATAAPTYGSHENGSKGSKGNATYGGKVTYGSRPFYIINNMTESPLKRKLESCENGPFSVSEFTIGHRGGATLQFPEETRQNAVAGARMGAGVLECDVAFTKDLELVCRHSQCDLHTTTDILTRPALAAKCVQPFTPANGTNQANATCCTSDITLAEYKSLCSKVDGFNASATTPQAYQRGGPTWRTDLYNTCAQGFSLSEHIDFVDTLPGFRNFTPECKTPPAAYVKMPFNGTFTQADFARKIIETYISKGIDYHRVWTQSFLPDDIFQWIKEYPDTFGRQAVYLDEDGDTPETLITAAARLPELRAKGVNYLAPPINYLLANSSNGTGIVVSDYAKAAKAADLDIISWTFERSGPLRDVRASNDYYYQTFASAVSFDGQLYEILDILVNQVGVVGLFTDWAETVSYYAGCLKVPGPTVAAQRREAADVAQTSLNDYE